VEAQAVKPRALTIAGSDPTGGAGIQQDLKTFDALDVWGLSAVTAVTVQDTTGVREWEPVPASVARGQIDVVMADIGCDAAKTGMLGTTEVVDAVARAAVDHLIEPLVIDPVLAAGAGGSLERGDLAAAIRELLLPRAALITPNTLEAAALTRLEISTLDEQKEAAVALAAAGPGAVLVTGGHLEGTHVTDVLFVEGELHEISSPRIDVDVHGTGCALSAAITGLLAKGETVESAVRRAHSLIADAIARALMLGKGAKVLEVRA
ncbi:MAG TPA: bifunctional hydroxymethylpyrimidine kinase/phosphomethylpyrimidine kinase, partial [Actinomycetota bacterium]|nr:bifunctional hydroxymethylpyrimidine kinase/phosphomethylpyrimidine kinase [Actinomycetota bacterium]